MNFCLSYQSTFGAGKVKKLSAYTENEEINREFGNLQNYWKSWGSSL